MDLIRQKKTAVLVIAFAVLVGMLFAPTCESFAATNGSGTTVAPKKVTGLKAIRKSYNKIKINWKTNKSVDGYYVYKKSKGHSAKRIRVIRNKYHSEYTAKVVPGVSYSFSVKAFKKVKVETPAPVESGDNSSADPSAGTKSVKQKAKTVTKTKIVTGPKATVKGKTYIDVPKRFKASTASNGIKLSWKKVRYASGYKVYRYIPELKKYKCIKTIKGASNTKFINKSTKVKKKFSYKVRTIKKINGKTYSSKKTKSRTGKTVRSRSSYYDPDTSLDVLAKGKTRVGCAYVGGCAGPKKFDCSGLVYWTLKNTKDNVVKPERSSCSGMYASTFHRYNIGTDTSKLRRGDIVLFGHGHSFHHTGIYAGNGKLLHAACPGKGVRIDPIRWLGHIGAIIRLP